MFDDFADGVVDFVGISLVDVVFSDCDGVPGGIGRVFDAVASRQNPILVQDRTSARAETIRTFGGMTALIISRLRH